MVGFWGHTDHYHSAQDFARRSLAGQAEMSAGELERETLMGVVDLE